MIIQKVGVIGCGAMGLGIARVAAAAGLQTILYKTTSIGTLHEVMVNFEKGLETEVEKKRLTKEAQAVILENLTGTYEMDHLKDRDLLIESIVEDLSEKQKLFKQLDEVANPGTILASNTSTLSITKLASVTRRADRVLGLHFFNPVPVMKLVEIVRTPSTSADVVEAAKSFVRLLGKTPVDVGDRPGFVVNRLLTAYLLDAIRSFESGLASMEDIDQAMKLGCNHPMGPLELCDFIGLDIVCAMAANLYSKLKEERFAPPPLLRNLVALEMLGKKTKNGFYDYTVKPYRPNPDLAALMVQDNGCRAW